MDLDTDEMRRRLSSVKQIACDRYDRASDVVAKVRISELYRALTGAEPRRTGTDRWRAVAEWRGGNGFNVSLDDERGLWHDFVTGAGGGVLDLIVLVRGGTRQEALRWAADFIGCPLDDRPIPAFDRARWVRQQRQIERELPNAERWRRAAVAMGEEILSRLKEALWDPKLPQPHIDDIPNWTTRVARWQRLEGAALVGEYLWWVRHQPNWAAALVNAARIREKAEFRAIQRYLSISVSEVKP